MNDNTEFPQSKDIKSILNKIKEQELTQNKVDNNDILSRETDPDLMITYETIKLPSKGMYYSSGISELNIEYMTSRDEDLLTTPSLIENGTALDILLKRKIKTKGIQPDELLPGDRNAVLLFLRSTSYGSDYTVQVTDPRTGVPFKEVVDLNKLKYKQINETPNESGYFKIELPMRKKTVLFKLLTVGEDMKIYRNAESLKEMNNDEISQYSTLKLKSSIVSINDITDRTYISKFVDAMPALDSSTIRRKIMEVSPDVDMTYTFTAKDGYTFNAALTIGLDFFFPNI